jgi:hypothetical protein
MAEYKLSSNNTVLRVADNVFIPIDPLNTDYAEFLRWTAAGGVADPYTGGPVPPPATPVVDANARIDAGILAAAATLQAAHNAIDAIPSSGAPPARLDALLAQMKITMAALVAMLQAQQNPP